MKPVHSDILYSGVHLLFVYVRRYSRIAYKRTFLWEEVSVKTT